MLAFITFSDQLGFWSPFIFWTIVVSVVLTLGFTVVVFFGGIGDVIYLLRSLDAEQAESAEDATDN